MEVALVIVIVLLAVGCFFALTAGVGMLRMPDFYTRLHPAGKADTAAQGLILMALIVLAIVGPPADEAQPPTEAEINHTATDGESEGGGHTDAEHAAQTQSGAATTAEHGTDTGHESADTSFGNQAPDIATAIKLLLIIAFLVITAPTATHAICKAAWLGKLQPWMNDEARANEAKANAESLDTLSNHWVSTTGIRKRADVEGPTKTDDDKKEDS